MSNHWAEVDAINLRVLDLFQDGQPRTVTQLHVPGVDDAMVGWSVGELTRLGYLKATWDVYTITLDGQGHLAEQRVAI